MRETTTGRKLNKNMIALVADVDRVCKNIQEKQKQRYIKFLFQFRKKRSLSLSWIIMFK